MADKFKLENLEQLDVDSILSSDQMLVQRLVENDNTKSYKIEISTLLGTVASQVSSIVSSSLSDYVLSSSLSDYETIANAQSSFISLSLSTDLSSDVVIGSAKLPTGNAIAQAIQSQPYHITASDLCNMVQVAVNVGANPRVDYTTQVEGWYKFTFANLNSSPTNLVGAVQFAVSVDSHTTRYESLFQATSSNNLNIVQILYLPASFTIRAFLGSQTSTSITNGGVNIYILKEGLLS